MRVGSLEIQIMAGVARLQKDMNDAQRIVGGSMANVERSVSSATRAMQAIGVGIPVAMMVDQVRRMTDQYIKLDAQMRLATKSQAEYAQGMSDIRRISTVAQSDLAATSMLYTRLLNVTQGMGIEQSKLATVTETVSYGLKAYGATAQEASSAALQLSQAMGANRLGGEEFRAVMEAMPNVMKVVADSMSESEGRKILLGDLRQLSIDGKITADVLLKALGDPAIAANFKSMAEQTQTVTGAWVVARNELTLLVGEFGKSSGGVNVFMAAFKAMGETFKLLATYMKELVSLATIMAALYAGRYVAALQAAWAMTRAHTAALVMDAAGMKAQKAVEAETAAASVAASAAASAAKKVAAVVAKQASVDIAVAAQAEAAAVAASATVINAAVVETAAAVKASAAARVIASEQASAAIIATTEQAASVRAASDAAELTSRIAHLESLKVAIVETRALTVAKLAEAEATGMVAVAQYNATRLSIDEIAVKQAQRAQIIQNMALIGKEAAVVNAAIASKGAAVSKALIAEKVLITERQLLAKAELAQVNGSIAAHQVNAAMALKAEQQMMAARAAHSAAMTELAYLGKQQMAVNTSLTAQNLAQSEARMAAMWTEGHAMNAVMVKRVTQEAAGEAQRTAIVAAATTERMAMAEAAVAREAVLNNARIAQSKAFIAAKYVEAAAMNKVFDEQRAASVAATAAEAARAGAALSWMGKLRAFAASNALGLIGLALWGAYSIVDHLGWIDSVFNRAEKNMKNLKALAGDNPLFAQAFGFSEEAMRKYDARIAQQAAMKQLGVSVGQDATALQIIAAIDKTIESTQRGMMLNSDRDRAVEQLKALRKGFETVGNVEVQQKEKIIALTHDELAMQNKMLALAKEFNEKDSTMTNAEYLKKVNETLYGNGKAALKAEKEAGKELEAMREATRQQQADMYARELEERKVQAVAHSQYLFNVEMGAKWDAYNETKKLNQAAFDESFRKQQDEVALINEEFARIDAASWVVGANNAMEAYLKEVGNVALNTERMMTKAFKGMEDALVKFVRTGKLDFRSLADSIMDDMVRMQIQESVTGPLMRAAKDAGGIGGLFKSWLPSFAGGGVTGNGPRSGGMDGKGGFPAILHPNETVIDHTKGDGQAAPSVTVIQNINIDSRSDRTTIIAAMQQAKEMAKGEIMDSLRRGGSFATAVGRA